MIKKTRFYNEEELMAFLNNDIEIVAITNINNGDSWQVFYKDKKTDIEKDIISWSNEAGMLLKQAAVIFDVFGLTDNQKKYLINLKAFLKK